MRSKLTLTKVFSTVLNHPHLARRLVVRLFNDYFRWPAPSWRLLGYCEAPVAGYTFRFSTTGMLAPIAFYRELVCGKWDGGAEDHVIAFIQNNLGSGETFFDVGAWIGVYSLLASRLVGRTGRVYAFEPDDMARQVLASNLRLNDARNVEVVPKALSDHVGEAPFGSNWHIGPLSLPCSRTGQILDESATGTKLQGAMKVPTTTLDDFSETIGRVPDMVKIDVEGHEVEVVRGAMLTLSNPKTTIILELHCETLSRKGYSPSTFLEQLEGIRPVKVLTAHGRLSSPHRVHLSDVVGHHIVMPRLK